MVRCLAWLGGSAANLADAVVLRGSSAEAWEAAFGPAPEIRTAF